MASSQDLVATAKNLVALAPVLGTISRPDSNKQIKRVKYVKKLWLGKKVKIERLKEEKNRILERA